MGKSWTDTELKAASAAMKAAGHMSYEELQEEMKCQDAETTYTVVFRIPDMGHRVEMHGLRAANYADAEKKALAEYKHTAVTIEAIYQDDGVKTHLDGKSAVFMTRREWIMLSSYIRMSTCFRTEERDAWQRISEDEKQIEELKQKAVSNAAFWAEMDEFLEKALEVIDEC